MQAYNPIKQEKKHFCREHHMSGKRYRALLKKRKREFKAQAIASSGVSNEA
jgi:hypothetical protein